MERRAFRDSRNLDYFEQDVIDCICHLIPSDYYESMEYDDDTDSTRLRKLKFDVYRTRCNNSMRQTDDLYLKLRLSRGVWLFVGSFKQQ